MEEQQNVARFWTDEKDSLNQKGGRRGAVGGAKPKECTVDVASPAIGALDHAGVDKASSKSALHMPTTEAERYIEDHQDALGKLANLEKLQKQADDIALASYLVHVRVKQIKLELARQVDEASDVKKTLARSAPRRPGGARGHDGVEAGKGHRPDSLYGGQGGQREPRLRSRSSQARR